MLVYPSIILRGNKQLNFVEGKKSKSCVEKKVFTTFTPNLSFPTFILHYPKKGKEGDISAQVEVNELCPIPFFSAGGATFLTNCFVILLEGLLLWDLVFTKRCWNKKVKMRITTVKNVSNHACTHEPHPFVNCQLYVNHSNRAVFKLWELYYIHTAIKYHSATKLFLP